MTEFAQNMPLHALQKNQYSTPAPPDSTGKTPLHGKTLTSSAAQSSTHTALAEDISLSTGKCIGHKHPCFIVAEIGNNHQGDLEVAKQLIHEAAQAGADAVKLQKRDTCALLSEAGRQAAYTNPHSFGATYGEHRDALELDFAAFAQLRETADSYGMTCFASPWDAPSLTGLLDMETELIKIASADLPTLPLVRQAAQTGLPIILSTGMSTMEEIALIVEEITRYHSRLVLLHCNSSYPCPTQEVALPVMQTLASRFGLPVGYSGHETALAPTLGAVALGACVVERHFTLDKAQKGTDHQASLIPEEFARLTTMIRDLEAALQTTSKQISDTEKRCAQKLRKSITATRDIPAGTCLTHEDVAVKCPGKGLSPLYWDHIPGCVLTRDMKKDEPLDEEAVQLPVRYS